MTHRRPAPSVRQIAVDFVSRATTRKHSRFEKRQRQALGVALAIAAEEGLLPAEVDSQVRAYIGR